LVAKEKLTLLKLNLTRVSPQRTSKFVMWSVALSSDLMIVVTWKEHIWRTPRDQRILIFWMCLKRTTTVI